jgi:uncharacterized membrane protein
MIALAASVWLVLLMASPVGPTSLAAITYTVGSFVCHQLPERSFHLGGVQIPVCARCIGVYGGFAVMAWAFVAAPRRPRSNGPRGLTARSARWIFVVSALPTALTLAVEWSGIWRGSNVVRAIAGSTLGVGLAFVVMSAVATLHYSGCEPRRPTEPSQLPPRI